MGSEISRRHSARASRLVEDTGSSYQKGRKGSRARAMRTACIGARRRCTSISRSTAGPTASRTAATVATACSSASREMCVRQGPGNGSNLSAVNPRATVSRACAAKLAGALSPPYQPLAYTRMRARHGPPSSACTGTPRHLPAMSQRACSSPLTALQKSMAPRLAEKSLYAMCTKWVMWPASRPTR
jgi:hypothetical protein